MSVAVSFVSTVPPFTCQSSNHHLRQFTPTDPSPGQLNHEMLLNQVLSKAAFKYMEQHSWVLSGVRKSSVKRLQYCDTDITAYYVSGFVVPVCRYCN